ncbi:MAG: hypothetical protein V4691_07320 [Pseudomonadota bacterium]
MSLKPVKRSKNLNANSNNNPAGIGTSVTPTPSDVSVITARAGTGTLSAASTGSIQKSWFNKTYDEAVLSLYSLGRCFQRWPQ